MITVVLVVHLLIAAAMVGVVLLQRSEGGALGMGGGGGGGFLTGRGTANLLTRVTAGLAAAFFVTSIALSMLSGRGTAPASVFDGTKPAAPAGAPAVPGTTPAAPGGVLDSLKQGDNQRLPSVPQNK